MSRWAAFGAVPELAGLLLSTRSVEGFLDDLAAAAAASSPVPMSCGITLAQQRRPTTVASSDALARSVDEGQYGTGQGPCLQALHDGHVVEVADFAAERRWGTYPAYALAFGVRSSLSVPLVADDLTVGALNLYAGATGVFDDAERTRVQALAAQCSAVLSVVLRQARQVELTGSCETPSPRAASSTRPSGSSWDSSGAPRHRPSPCSGPPASTGTASSATSPPT